MTEKVSINILNYKNWEATIGCLDSITQNITYPVQVIIVDNASGNESLAEIENWIQAKQIKYKRIKENEITRFTRADLESFDFLLIEAGQNYGYAIGNNIGFKVSSLVGADYCLLLNSDIIITKDFIAPFIGYFKKMRSLAVLSPLIVLTNGLVDENCMRRRRKIPFDYLMDFGLAGTLLKKIGWKHSNGYKINSPGEELMEVDVVSGAAFMIRQDYLDQVNGFGTETFLYEEEYILHEKLRKHQLKTFVALKYPVIHSRGESSKELGRETIRGFFWDSTYQYLTQYRNKSKLYAGVIINYMKLSSFFYNTALKNIIKKKEHSPEGEI